jgi:hypothetical protein
MFVSQAGGRHSVVRTRRILQLVVLAAVVLRVGSAFILGNAVDTLPGIYDQVSYHALAQRVTDGYGFSFAERHWPLTRAGEPTAHWSYLYTLYLAAVYALVGASPLVARLIQAVVVGILHPWLVWRIGRRIGGSTVGLVSAALSAIYIYFVYYAGALMTETFYITGILWTLDCALRLLEQGKRGEGSTGASHSGWGLWLELGLAIGVTVLLRQLFLLFVPFLLLWLWWNCLQPGQRAEPVWQRQVVPLLAGTLLAGLVVTALVLPWTVRNYRVFDRFVLLNTNSGYAFFWGNHPIYGTHFVGILPQEGPSYQELIPLEVRHLDEAAMERALLARGVGFVLADPLRYVLLSLSRTREYFKFWPSPDSSLLSNVARVTSFGLLLPFMLYGLVVVGRRAWHPLYPGQRAGIILLLLFVLFYTAIHLLTWALIRYRLPVDAVLLIAAAAGMVDLAKRVGLLPRRRTILLRPSPEGIGS